MQAKTLDEPVASRTIGRVMARAAAWRPHIEFVVVTWKGGPHACEPHLRSPRSARRSAWWLDVLCVEWAARLDGASSVNGDVNRLWNGWD